jgi:LEA14-like dessication related protein
MKKKPLFASSWLLLIAALLLNGCAALNPKVEAPGINITSLELLETQGLSQRFKIGLLVTNPNASALPVSGMSYTLSLNGYDLIKGVSNKIPKLPAYSETPITLEASTDMFNALRLLNSLVNKPQETLDYAFAAKFDVGSLRPPMHVKRDGKIELQNLGAAR